MKKKYQAVLNKNGYSFKLRHGQYVQIATEKKKVHRAIIWSNPPCSKHVQTNKGKPFFGILVRRHLTSRPRIIKGESLVQKQ